MEKIICIRLSESEYALLKKVTKQSGKNISSYVRDLLKNSIKKEVEEFQLLNRLVNSIENLNLSNNLNVIEKIQFLEKEIEEIMKILYMLLEHEKLVAELKLVLEEDREKYFSKLKTLEEKYLSKR